MNKEIGGSINVNSLNEELIFKDVTFGFGSEEKTILKNINLRIPALKTSALIAKSGAGKTTIVDMLTLLPKSEKGEILIDGISSNQISLTAWRNSISYVSQECVIFDDTIFNNIAMWPDNSQNEEMVKHKVIEAARKASIHDFIESSNLVFRLL